MAVIYGYALLLCCCSQVKYRAKAEAQRAAPFLCALTPLLDYTWYVILKY